MIRSLRHIPAKEEGTAHCARVFFPGAGVRSFFACCLMILTAAVTAQSQSADLPLTLTLKRAVEIAVSAEGNTRVQLAGESIVQAKDRSAQARSALLPRLDASVTQQNLTRNLAAMGIHFNAPGFQIPAVTDPFNFFDARVSLNQSIFDFSSIRSFQASKLAVESTRSDRDSIQDQVASDVASAYLQALRAKTRVEAVNADIELSESVLKSAEGQRSAGTGTGMEVIRARVQLLNQRQRLLLAQNDQRRSELQLRRAMNLKLDTDLELTDSLGFPPVDPQVIEDALSKALGGRADLRAQEQREENARLSTSATRLEKFPTILGFGDYGSTGAGVNNAVPTRTYGLSLRVPVFDGGRREARSSEAESQFRQQRLRTNDLRQEVELQVRTAIDNLRSAEAQVQVAEEGLMLAEMEVAQARRRLDAGVGTSLEVTDAQTRLEQARENRIAALFNYNQARLDLGQATGTIMEMIQ